MKEYIDKDTAIKWVSDLAANMSVCTSIDVCLGMKSMKSRALSTLSDIPAADVVPWEWLKRYAHGKGMQDASTFIFEAMEAWKNEQDVH